MKTYLIVGGSAGAIGAAEAIRETDPDGRIVMVSREAVAAYSRPMISEYLSHKVSLSEMYYRPLDYYAKVGINLITGRSVRTIDVTARVADLNDGSRIEWDEMLLATGGLPIVPRIEGVDKRGVFSFTMLADADKLNAAIEAGARVATVIGGGLIGVSVSDALVKRGLRVTLVELLDRVLKLTVDGHASCLVTDAMRRAGVEIVTGHSALAITGLPSEPDRVGGVILDDGRHVVSDIVVLAVGVRPNAELARAAGLRCERGIVVDGRMATSDPHVYACGDAVEAPALGGDRRVVPLWPFAYLGGRTAGINMAGGNAEYPGAVNLSTLKYFGTRIVAAGVVEPEGDDTEILVSNRKGNYRKAILSDDRVIGFVFANDIERSGLIFGLLREGVNVGKFKQQLVSDSFGLVALPTELRRQIYDVVMGGVT